MFIGHLGVGLALKKAEPRVNLAMLLFASLFLDVLLGLFVLSGYEKLIVPDDYAQLHYLHFSFPYSHSLVAAVIWSLLAFALTYSAWRGDVREKFKVATIIAAAVLIHWVCDWLEHPPQLPVAGPGSSMLGLGLWNKLGLALTIEVLLVVAGTRLYLTVADNIGRIGRWGIVVIMSIISMVAVIGQMTVTIAPGQNAVAISMILQAIVIISLAAWVDHNRCANVVRK